MQVTVRQAARFSPPFRSARPPSLAHARALECEVEWGYRSDPMPVTRAKLMVHAVDEDEVGLEQVLVENGWGGCRLGWVVRLEQATRLRTVLSPWTL